MTCKLCPQPTSGKSKYCRAHAREARAKWLEMIHAKAAERDLRYISYQELLTRASDAGSAAGKAAVPVPMVVSDTQSSARWYVPGGVCGFGAVKVRPGNCSFARWAVKQGVARPTHYDGGVSFHSPFPTQSLAVHEAWAHAFADVLRAGGIRATSDCRID